VIQLDRVMASEAVSAAWTELCDGLKCASAVQIDGLTLLTKLSGRRDTFSDQPTGSKSGALAAVLYLSCLRLKENLPIARLLNSSGLNMKDFFYNVEEQHGLLQLPAELLENLKKVKAQHVVCTVAFSKFRAFFQVLFPSGLVGGKDGELMDESVQLGWLIFIFAKCKLQGARGDLMSAYHLLVCVLHLLLAHVPVAARNAGVFWSQLDKEVPADCYPFPEPAVVQLCGLLKANREEVAKVEPGMRLVVEELRRLSTVSQTVGDGFGGQFTVDIVHNLLIAVTHQYDEMWPRQSTQFDERFYFVKPSTRSGSASSVPASPCRPSPSPRSNAEQQMLTPLRNGVANAFTSPVPRSSTTPRATPVTSQLQSVSWLREAVLPVAAEPDSALHHYFSQCQATTPAAAIRDRLQILCGRVRQQLQLVESEMIDDVDERCDLARRLYYKMLLAFLQAEETRLKQSDFSTLLANESFHCSLFACCMEAVCAAYSMSSLAFPAVLDILDLRAFDFCKVIESFVIHEPSLPSHLRRHFAEVDATILESLAWDDESPLHALMAEYDISTGSSANASSNQMRAKTALEQFLTKVLKLAAARIQEMCTRLLLPSKLMKQVWECLKVVINTSRHLLQGRHLDQLIMCTVYGVCKVNQKSVTFRHIIEQYKRQPKATARVFREVRMKSASEPPQDIICFYNQIFIPSMKDQLMRICSIGGRVQEADSTSNCASPEFNKAQGAASPQQVSAQHDVFISQPRMPSGSTMTPRTRTLYSFGNTPGATPSADRLQHINHQLNCATGSDGAAMHALQQLSNTPLSASQRSAMSSLPEETSRKRGVEDRGLSRRNLVRRQRMMEQGFERSSSTSSDAQEGDEQPTS